MIVPTVINKENGTLMASDIYSSLLRERVIFVTGEVNSTMAEVVKAQLLYLNFQDQEKEIMMFIDSPGGSVSAGLSIVDVMHFIKAPVHTFATGDCASMGAVLLACGDKRSSFKNSSVMLHMVSGGNSGVMLDVEVAYNKMKQVNDTLMKLLAEKTKHSLEEVRKDCERDFWMNAEQALAYGIIDEIVANQA